MIRGQTRSARVLSIIIFSYKPSSVFSNSFKRAYKLQHPTISPSKGEYPKGGGVSLLLIKPRRCARPLMIRGQMRSAVLFTKQNFSGYLIPHIPLILKTPHPTISPSKGEYPEGEDVTEIYIQILLFQYLMDLHLSFLLLHVDEFRNPNINSIVGNVLL
ncbi:hypothetical protein Palpr_1484 [Paludibacter propionicigenes WB4]|uniref:Uncharacterized protein n=1 Tax=Paludibacter propionicigenes (strain DSM 17365 / JCM 13257 / WB4) TaxID=694427 RepID=E4T4I6_PALPW|nr:hypothetical protein Palpr_1484 [Paludibacter propionicigenes WB4]